MNAEAKREKSSSWPWLDSLDAVIAARDYHRILFENERVRILEVRIQPGQIVPVPPHRRSAAVYVLSACDFIRRDENGSLLFDSRTAGMPRATPAAQ